MQTLDEMLNRHLLTQDQYTQIRACIAEAGSPQAIMDMPAHLWRSLELASVLMGVDADLMRPASLGDEADPGAG
jgi:hypothetical protein